MKKKLFYIATTLYSNAQAVRASIKSFGYALIAFILSSLMLTAPIAIQQYSTSGEALMAGYPSASEMLYHFVVKLDNEGVTCRVENEKFVCKGELSKNLYVITEDVDGKTYTYTYVILDNDYNYDNFDETEAKDNDNLIYFGEDKFYIRNITRGEDGSVVSNILSGTYRYCGDFDFDTITGYMDNFNEDRRENMGIKKTYEVFCSFLYNVEMSGFNAVLFLWFLLAIVTNLICVISGCFILYYGNKKGNLADQYGIKGSLKIACILLLLPAIISVAIGLILPDIVIISAPLIYFIRVFLIYRAQFTRKGQKLAIKTKKGLEDCL